MAFFQVQYFSDALMRTTSFHMFLPNDLPAALTESNPYYTRNTKVIYLLHGFFGSSMDWVMGSPIWQIAEQYNLAVVMPSAENSFYLDGHGTAGRSYGRFIGEELVAYIRKTFGLLTSREDTIIGGLSMGGFGAIHTGLGYPETFGKIFALSAAMIIHEIKNQQPGFETDIAVYDYYKLTFGNLEYLEQSMNNPENLLKIAIKEKKEIPSIYMTCGKTDSLLEANRQFFNFLVEHQVNATYVEKEGSHDWKFWSENLETVIRWAID